MTSPEPSTSPQHPHRARGPRGWISVSERIVMNHRHTRARALDVATRRVDRGVRTFFCFTRSRRRSRARTVDRTRARGFVGSRPWIDPVDVPRVARRSRRATNARVGGIRARKFRRSFRRRFALAPRSRARGRRFDSIRLIRDRGGVSFIQARFGRTSSFARESGESRRRTPHHSVLLKDLADRSRGA